jgi:hypothetical protein
MSQEVFSISTTAGSADAGFDINKLFITLTITLIHPYQNTCTTGLRYDTMGRAHKEV